MRVVVVTISGLAVIVMMVVILRGHTELIFALRRKGYEDRFSWHILLAFVPFAAMFVPIGVAELLGTDTTSVSPVAGLVLVAVTLVCCYVGSLLTHRLIDQLPEAPPRGSPPDRPYTLFATVSAAGILVAPLTAFLLGYSWSAAGRAFELFLIVTTGFAAAAARQFARSQAASALAAPSPRVLYMRPFSSEEEVFARIPRTGLWRFIPLPDRTSAETGIGSSGYQTFETYIQPPLLCAIGPLVALGSPRDRLPQANGAIRIYLENQEWQKRFAELAASCVCIVGTTSVSANVRQELCYMLQEGLAPKLFLCTSPAHSDWFEEVYLRLWAVLFGPKAAGFWKLEPPPWPEMAAALRAAGYDRLPADPGPGTVITFTSAGAAQILTQSAQISRHYVDAIVHQLKRIGLASPASSEF
jgi:hypothetical protein